MVYDNNKDTVTFSKEEIVQYKKRLINQTYACLGIYEDCLSIDNFDTFFSYLSRFKIEMFGFAKNCPNSYVMSIANIVAGIDANMYTHKEIKRIVFHLISIIEKIEV